MEKEDIISVQRAQEDVETSYNLLNNNNNVLYYYEDQTLKYYHYYYSISFTIFWCH